MKTAEDKVVQASALLTEWAHKQHHDRCWYYPDVFDQLCDLLGVQRPERPALPPRCEFEQGCSRYQNEQYGEKVDEQPAPETNEWIEPNQWITEARNLLDCDFKAHGVKADIRNCLIELSDYAEKLESEVNELRESMKKERAE